MAKLPDIIKNHFRKHPGEVAFASKDLMAKLPDIIKNHFRKHPGEVAFANQVSIAVALNVLDYSSLLDKFEMNIIIDDDEIKPGKCYGPWHVMMTNPITFVLIMIKNNTIQLNTN